MTMPFALLDRKRSRHVFMKDGVVWERILLIDRDGFEKKEDIEVDGKHLRVRRTTRKNPDFFNPAAAAIESDSIFVRSPDYAEDGRAIFRDAEL